jgi:hypothetical protein
MVLIRTRKQRGFTIDGSKRNINRNQHEARHLDNNRIRNLRCNDTAICERSDKGMENIMALLGFPPIGYEGLEYFFKGIIFVIVLSTVLDIMKGLIMNIGKGGM